MKDYSKEIDALNFLKRYLLIENQIEKNMHQMRYAIVQEMNTISIC